jgi:hypothetical protein
LITNNESKQPKSHFLRDWIFVGTIGGVISLIVFFALVLLSFVNGGEAPPPPPEMLTEQERIQRLIGYILLYSIIGFLSAIPLGVAQWLVLRRRFARSFLWTLTYSIGLVAFFVLSSVTSEYSSEGSVTMLVGVLILSWIFASTFTGGLQALILRN